MCFTGGVYTAPALTELTLRAHPLTVSEFPSFDGVAVERRQIREGNRQRQVAGQDLDQLEDVVGPRERHARDDQQRLHQLLDRLLAVEADHRRQRVIQ
jgi:hypothetical protein